MPDRPLRETMIKSLVDQRPIHERGEDDARELCENEGKSLLHAVSLTTKLARCVVAHAPDLNDIGIRVLQAGSFNLNFSDADRQRLVDANSEIAKAERSVRIKQIGVAVRSPMRKRGRSVSTSSLLRNLGTSKIWLEATKPTPQVERSLARGGYGGARCR